MSKKKNTLKDLDEFLKQQAATLVEPTQLSDTIQAPPTARKDEAKVEEITVTEREGLDGDEGISGELLDAKLKKVAQVVDSHQSQLILTVHTNHTRQLKLLNVHEFNCQNENW
jgi:hypothetical protein